MTLAEAAAGLKGLDAASGPMIAHYEKGTRTVPLARLEQMCALYGVPFAFLASPPPSPAEQIDRYVEQHPEEEAVFYSNVKTMVESALNSAIVAAAGSWAETIEQAVNRAAPGLSTDLGAMQVVRDFQSQMESLASGEEIAQRAARILTSPTGVTVQTDEQRQAIERLRSGEPLPDVLVSREADPQG